MSRRFRTPQQSCGARRPCRRVWKRRLSRRTPKRSVRTAWSSSAAPRAAIPACL